MRLIQPKDGPQLHLQDHFHAGPAERHHLQLVRSCHRVWPHGVPGTDPRGAGLPDIWEHTDPGCRGRSFTSTWSTDLPPQGFSARTGAQPGVDAG